MQGWQARPGWMLFALHASDKQAPAPLWLHACRAAPADIKRMPARGTGARHSQKWAYLQHGDQRRARAP